MITTWDQRARREGIVVKKISFPIPLPSPEAFVDRIREAITPRTRVIEFPQITNLSGQILPVRDVVRLGREKGIEVFIDGAHAFAHFPFKRDDLECDYFGSSLHKWLLAPIGTGFLYVRKAKQKTIWPLMAADPALDEDIRKYEQIGTHPAANHNAIVGGPGVPPRDRRRPQDRPPALPARPLGQAPARGRPARQGLDAARTTTPLRAPSAWCRLRASIPAGSSAISGTKHRIVTSPSSTPSSRASASRPTSTPGPARSTSSSTP